MRALLLLALGTLVLSLVLGGGAPFGRLALAVGLSYFAAPFFSDPAWQGVAKYRAGDVAGAAAAFTEARMFYNLGNAHALDGSYAAALEAYDSAIAQGNADAQTNFDMVARHYAGLQIDPETLALFPKRRNGPTAEAEVAQGNARAAGTGDEATNNTMLGLAELDSRGRLGVRRIFDDAYMVADERWLQQLSDVPGDFLKARIAHERKRRASLGLAPPPPEDPR
ncbi:MAG: tetratricopeptide repeat protein [Pseudomonadota bacterium]